MATSTVRILYGSLANTDLLDVWSTHNTLPTTLPAHEILQHGVITLLGIIRKHKAQSWARVTLNHRHTELAPQHILASTKLDDMPAIWTTPTSLDALDSSTFYPNVLVVRSGAFAIVELRKGQAPRALQGKEEFFQEFLDRICQEGWEELFGISVEENWASMIEFVLPNGNLLVHAQAINTSRTARHDFVYTCWATGNETHAKTGVTACFVYGGTHVEVKDTRMQAPSDYWNMLAGQGYLLSSSPSSV